MTDHEKSPWTTEEVKTRTEGTAITAKVEGRKRRSLGDGTWEFAECSKSDIEGFVGALKAQISCMPKEDGRTHFGTAKSLRRFIKASFDHWVATENLAERPYRQGSSPDSARPNATTLGFDMDSGQGVDIADEPSEPSDSKLIQRFRLNFKNLAREPEWRFPVPPVIAHSQIENDDSILLAMAPDMRHTKSGDLMSLSKAFGSKGDRVEDLLLSSLGEQGYDFEGKALIEPYHIHAFETRLSEHISHKLRAAKEGASGGTKMRAFLSHEDDAMMPAVNQIDLPAREKLKPGTILHSALTLEGSTTPVYAIQLLPSSHVEETQSEGGKSKGKKRKVELSLSLLVRNYHDADAAPVSLESLAFTDSVDCMAQSINDDLDPKDRISFDGLKEENSAFIDDWGFDMARSLLIHLQHSHIGNEANGSTVRKNGPKLYLSGGPTLLISCTFPSGASESNLSATMGGLSLEHQAGDEAKASQVATEDQAEE